MSIEDELLPLARAREEETQNALGRMFLTHPADLGRELRTYLSQQVDAKRMRRTEDKAPHLTPLSGDLNELICEKAEFYSGSRLTFNIQLMRDQRGWLLKQFEFKLRLPHARRIQMVQIHLNPDASRDPLTVPRCHLHIDNGPAHTPFPAMNPRLILHLLCEHIEPEFGA